MAEQTKKLPFVLSRLNEAKWVPGLRPDFEYRDLGIDAATNGQFLVQTIRAVDNGTEHDVSKHHHDTGFHFLYMLEGEATFNFEGHGEVTFKKGDCWFQPDGIKHSMPRCNDEAVFLEIATPADFNTTQDE